jgi:hypothetical protein
MARTRHAVLELPAMLANVVTTVYLMEHPITLRFGPWINRHFGKWPALV